MTEDAGRAPDREGEDAQAQSGDQTGNLAGNLAGSRVGAELVEAPAGPPDPSADADQEGAPVGGDPTRRDLLAKAACALGACAFVGAGGVVGAAVVGTPLQRAEGKTRWCPVGPAGELPQGPRKLPVRAPGHDAWRRFADRSLGRVVVVKEGDDLRAFSAACPHNGCDVSIAEGGVELLCPCHHSRFALDGERIEGQSPRGLDPLATRVREGQLEVEWKRFALGTAERKPV